MSQLQESPTAASTPERDARYGADALMLRLEVETFLYEEAALLDEWRLDEWLALFTDDGRYIVPSTDCVDGDGDRTLVLLDDDHMRLAGRVARLKSRRAHREFPSSRTRRHLSNVRVVGQHDDELSVVCNFIVHRVRGSVDAYIGQYRYTLVRTEESFRIRLRRVELDLETLRPHGTLSIIV